MSLEIGFRQIHDVKVVSVRGRIVCGDGAAEFRAALRLVARDGWRKILLDLGEAPHLDSSGLGVLVSEFARARSQGRQIKLLKPTKRVVDLLLATRLFPLFEVFSEESVALHSFGVIAAAG